MAMRMTEKQRAFADQLGIRALRAGISLSHIWPVPTPKEWENRIPAVDWEEHFKRKDITPANKDELNAICFAAYEREYNAFMMEAMTPTSKSEYDIRNNEKQAFRAIFSAGAINLADQQEVDEIVDELFGDV